MKKLIYIGDPMCSWCYGFAPVISEIYNKYCDQIKFSVMLGGLYTGGSTFQDKKRIKFLRQTWQRISDFTGQPFNFSILDTEDWLYDTELASRAVVAVRRLNPGLTLDYFHEIQEQFYVHGEDMQSLHTFKKAVQGLGIDTDHFENEITSDDCIEETRQDFITAREFGVNGFPTILLNDAKGWGILNEVYQELNVIEPVLQNWLEMTSEV